MLENVLQILGVNLEEGSGEVPLTECTSKQWSTLQVGHISTVLFNNLLVPY